jgi:hypothetical protein
MITLPEIEKFVTALSEKGYHGQFYAPRTGKQDLKPLLIAYQDAHRHDPKTPPFPPVIGTFIGEPQGDLRTICTLTLKHDPAQGLQVSGILATRCHLERPEESLAKARLVVSSMQTMPAKTFVNALVVPIAQQQKKKRRGLSR